MSRPGPFDYAMLVLLAAFWGGSFLFIKIGVRTIPALSLTSGRLVIAAVLLSVAALIARQRLKPRPGLWFKIVLAGLLGNGLPFVLISWGEEVIDSGLAAILMAVMPLMTVLFAHVFTADEKLDAPKSIGVALGIAGLVVLIGPDKLSVLGDETLRQLSVAGAAVCYAVNALVIKRMPGQPPNALAAAIIWSSAAMMIPMAIIYDYPLTLSPDAPSLFAMVMLGVVQTAMAALLMLAIIGRQGAAFFSQINFLVPLFGTLAGVIFLAERPSPNAWAALVLIMCGIAISRRSGRMVKLS